MMIVPPSSLLNSKWVADLALKHGLASCFNCSRLRFTTEGLIAFIGRLACRVRPGLPPSSTSILKGAKPADLPGGAAYPVQAHHQRLRPRRRLGVCHSAVHHAARAPRHRVMSERAPRFMQLRRREWNE